MEHNSELRKFIFIKYYPATNFFELLVDYPGYSNHLDRLFYECMFEEEARIKALEKEQGRPLHYLRENLQQRHAASKPGGGVDYTAVRCSTSDHIHDTPEGVVDHMLNFWVGRFGNVKWYEEGAFKPKACEEMLADCDMTWPMVSRPTYEKVQMSIKYSGNSSPGKGGASFIHLREGGPKVAEILYPVTLALSDPDDDDPPISFKYARLILPPKNGVEEVGGQSIVNDDEVRPISVHEATFRVACGAYVWALRESSEKMTSAEQVGFMESTVGNVYGADYHLHKVSEGEKGGESGHSPLSTMSTLRRYLSSQKHRNGSPHYSGESSSSWFTSSFSEGLVTRSGATIFRGVTQGNPIAPDFFVNLFEPLVRRVKKELREGEKIFAFADDVILILLFILRLRAILPIFWLFGAASGCILNVKKSNWVYGKKPTKEEAEWWKSLPVNRQEDGAKFVLPASAKALGCIIGKWVTAEERLAPTHNKVKRTIAKWTLNSSQSFFERVVTLNVYILSIYSYILKFTPFAKAMLIDIKRWAIIFVCRTPMISFESSSFLEKGLLW